MHWEALVLQNEMQSQANHNKSNTQAIYDKQQVVFQGPNPLKT